MFVLDAVRCLIHRDVITAQQIIESMIAIATPGSSPKDTASHDLQRFILIDGEVKKKEAVERGA